MKKQGSDVGVRERAPRVEQNRKRLRGKEENCEVGLDAAHAMTRSMTGEHQEADEGGKSDLPLDVDAGKGRGTASLESRAGFGGQENDGAATVLEKVLAVMVQDELRRFDVGLEVEFLCDKAQLHILLVSGAGELASTQGAGEEGATYALQMLHRAAKRSRRTNISMRYAPMLGVSL